MYLAGFGNHHQSEALAGALPTQQNSPQKCAYGLYAEQLSGTAFTRPRQLNYHSWLYKRVPSVVHGDYQPYSRSKPCLSLQSQAPNPYRWLPWPFPEKPLDFIDGLSLIASNSLLKAYLYHCSVSMQQRYFINHDGEMLFVPYLGNITLFTEFGRFELSPGQISVIPRGVYFKLSLNSPQAAGYLCENSGALLSLPQLGPLGANALANPRHFLYPVAGFEEGDEDIELIAKFNHELWLAKARHSPLNTVAWHGNYAPYFYDLSLFNTINSVSFDHPDPSIFTVLTAESEIPGVASLDFVIFPPRWMVAEHTFRPPYFHRNIMSELMGLINGSYDAKAEGFLPGGVSIHNRMTAHGPDAATYKIMSQGEEKPCFYADTLAFMFESNQAWMLSEKAFNHPSRQKNYSDCWQDLEYSQLSST